MIDFEPNEDQRLIKDSVASFAKATLGPRAREHEKARGVSEEVRKLAHEMGLGLVTLPESAGGSGLGLTTAVLLEEELGSADAGAAFGLGGPGAFGALVLELAPEQAGELLADFGGADGHARFGAVAFSEARSLKERAGFSTVAVAEGEGYVITGKKCYVGNAALAQRFVVVAQVDPDKGWAGLGAFVVERDNPGVTIGARHDTLGLDAASFGEVSFKGAAVPASARLGASLGGDDFTRALLRFFAKQSLLVAARATGLARFAYELALEHCDNRKAFGKPIGHFQAVAFTLADRLMDVDASRWLIWRAACAWDQKQPEKEALRATAQASATALEAAMRTADDCVGLHGGSGFIRDLIAEKLMRDAKQLALCALTPEQLDQIASAIELGAPLDPALCLPTPETQAVFI
ncbi:MAG: acyl-CoA dehydrogenase family protein [Byssovorax sp.]